MQLVIFTEASPAIGHGHVMRCHALAVEARRRGVSVVFSCHEHYLTNLLKHLGETAVRFGAYQKAEWVIRDFSGGSEAETVQVQRDNGSQVLLLDDPGHARLYATIVSDGFMTAKRQMRYPHSNITHYLYGLNYFPLHPKFVLLRHSIAMSDRLVSKNRRLLIALGGTNPKEQIFPLLDALNIQGFQGPADIVVAPFLQGDVRLKIKNWKNSNVFSQISNMEFLIKNSALVITKIGVTLAEAFCMGTGCVLIEPTSLHLELSHELAATYDHWPAFECGLATDVDYQLAAQSILNLLEDTHRLRNFSAQSAELVDGLGSQRLLNALLENKG